MSSQPEPTPGKATRARQITEPLREIAALVLVAANALLLLVGLIDLVVPFGQGSEFSDRAGGVFFDFIGVEGIVLPLLAVLLATHIEPPVRRAKEITLAAVAQYAFSAVFGGLAVLGWLVGTLAEARLRDAFTGLLVRGAYVAIFAVAAFLVVKVWLTLYRVPRPKRQPGLYGQPRPYGEAGYPPPGAGPQGYPGGYPQGSGFPPAAGYPQGSGHPQGYPQGQPPASPYGSTAGYGQPTYPPATASTWSASVSAPPAAPTPTSGPPTSGPPVSGPPTFGPPSSGPPTSGPPPAGGPSGWAAATQADVVEPTQVIPPPAPSTSASPTSTPPAGAAPVTASDGTADSADAADADSERTRVIGSAGQQPGGGDADSEQTRVINPASQQPSAGSPPPAPGADDSARPPDRD